MLVVFAILGTLIGLLFLYIRQKLAVYETRLNLLTDTVQTIASLNHMEYKDCESEESEESESEDESEDESEEINLKCDEIKCEEIDLETKTIVLEPVVTVSDDVVTSEYDKFSLKELKEKVVLLGGPKLRTKKELVDFLNKS